MIDEDIRVAKTLPSRFYTDKECFLEQKNLFNRWQFAAHKSDIAANNIIPLDVIESITKESLILVGNDSVQCLSNVCTHRGMRLAIEACQSKGLQCKYHGRRFNLDGTFLYMPEFEEAMNFPTEEDNLAEFPLTEWNGIYFTAIDVLKSLDLSFLDSRLSWLNISEFERDPTRNREYTINANWALYCENYLEGFHIPYVHPELNQVLDYSDYRVECFDGGVLQIGMAKENDVCFDIPDSSPDCGLKIAAYYVWLFPNLMLNFYPWGLSVNIVVPISVNETKIIYQGYVKDSSLTNQGAGGELDLVEAQDQEIVEMIQKGMVSRAYDRGRYSPTMEKGVHHFHRMLTEN